MDRIEFTPNGISKQLKTLDVRKASGPDNIPTRILKLTADETSRVLAVIFQHSYDKGHSHIQERKQD